jgi:putative transposase
MPLCVTLERVCRWYGFYVMGYVVMPEHVHLLISEPERGALSLGLADVEADPFPQTEERGAFPVLASSLL